MRFQSLVAVALLALPMAVFAQDAEKPAKPTPPKVGEVFPEFEAKTWDGKDIKLSDYRGKYVLVDFWATWCGPCRAEIPNMKKVYSTFHDKGFEIVGISLDRDEAAIRKFYEDETTTVPWTSVYDGKFWQAELAVKHGINSIPATFLLDKEGVIVATNLKGNGLTKEVAKHLDPDFKVVLTYEEMISAFLAGDADARAKLTPDIVAATTEAELPAANEFAWTYLDSGRAVDPAVAQMVLDSMGPQMTDAKKHWMEADTVALAAYFVGNHKEALRYQTMSLEGFRAVITERNAPMDEVMQSDDYADVELRLALYEAANGNHDSAKARIARLQGIERLKPFLANNRYLKLAQGHMKPDA